MRRAAPIVLVASLLVAGCGSSHPSTAPSTKPTVSAPAKTSPSMLSVSVAPWHLPFAIAREGVVALGSNKVLVGGGMFPDDTSSARAFTLDLTTGRATTLPTLSVDVHDVAGGRYGGDPAIYGGGNASEQSTVQQFHNGVWRVVDHMPTTRSDLSVATIGGATYVLGGYDGTGVPTQVLAQTGNGLRPAGHLVEGVRYAATAVLGSSIYLFGGEVSGAELSAVQRYDTTTHRTTVVGRLPVALGHASAVALGGRILVMGGRVNPNQGTRVMWWFDPANGRFTKAGNLPAPVTDAAVATSSDGRTAWLLGGEAPTVRDAVIELTLS